MSTKNNHADMQESAAQNPLLDMDSQYNSQYNSQYARRRQQPFNESPRWSDEAERDKHGSYTHVTPVKPDGEQPKVLYVTSLSRSLIQYIIFHIPPVAVTLGLLAVYVLRISWGVGNEGLAALLIAAKVHEALIIASLFHILFYHIRRGLLGSNGIPFGFLTAAFQLSSPFYLFNSSFIAPLLRYRPVTLSSLVLASLMVLTFTLAALSGASSGIVMIPRLDWWEIDLHKVNGSLSVGGADGESLRSHRQLIIAPVERLYPTKIDAQSYPQECNDGGTVCSAYLTTNAGYGDEGGTSWSWLTTKGLGVMVPENITMQNRIMAWWQSYQVPGDHYVATIPNLNTAGELTYSSGSPITGWGRAHPFPSRISSKISDQAGRPLPIKQPRLAVQCTNPKYPVLQPSQGEKAEDSPLRFQMERGLYPQFEFSLNRSLFAAANQTRRWVGFLDLADVAPVPTSGSFWTWDPKTGNLSTITICFIDARWMNSDTWVLPQTGSAALFGYSIDKEAIQSTANQSVQSLDATRNTGDFITLEPAWLESIDTYKMTLMAGLKPGRILTFYNYMLELIAGEVGTPAYDNSTFHKDPLEWAMTVTLTNLVSAVPYSWNSRSLSSDSFFGPWNTTKEVAGNITEVDFETLRLPSYARHELFFEHNIYEYNFNGTTTKLAWAVLLTHVLLVLIHLVVTSVQGSWQSNAWSQLGDLLALAVNTRPTSLLRNTGVRVKNWDTWRLTAYVRVSGDGTGLELDLQDKAISATGVDDGRYPEANRSYG